MTKPANHSKAKHMRLAVSGLYPAVFSAAILLAGLPGSLTAAGFTNPPCCAAIQPSSNSTNWAWNCINLKSAWDVLSTTSNMVTRVIAVIDNGVDISHPAIANRSWTNRPELNGVPLDDDDHNGFTDDHNGWDFVTQRTNTVPTSDHGTRVAGIIGAIATNTRIMDVRWTDQSGSGALSNLLSATSYALRNGVQIINISGSKDVVIGSPEFTNSLEVFRDAESRGVLVVASAPEDQPTSGQISVPCMLGFTNIISVTGIERMPSGKDSYLKGVSNSNAVDIAAPAEGIIGPEVGGGYGTGDGTSFASPLVTGSASLIWGLMPNLSAGQIRHLILGNAFQPPDTMFTQPHSWGHTFPAKTNGVLNLSFVKSAYEKYKSGAAFPPFFDARANGSSP